ncbi:hypothetical protein M7I_0207 [Glarea lozoyensis 74030]|uniref:Uncharacterized protein n=1 Tax=Glarea lozoyensis (strain ATCC 74030 / MF5533) TaxID=1104152 RepID=H0ECR2_GLAL7|nr:hypothetical protein M7I_0207 [Glarea lozoyensis 74030]
MAQFKRWRTRITGVLPGRSKKEVEERRLKYAHIDQAVYNMMSGIVSGFEAAELQKAAFVAAGQSAHENENPYQFGFNSALDLYRTFYQKSYRSK